jgi:hypothetical protein
MAGCGERRGGEGAAVSHVGVNLGFGNLREKLTDEQMYAGELALAELADRLGYGPALEIFTQRLRGCRRPLPAVLMPQDVPRSVI